MIERQEDGRKVEEFASRLLGIIPILAVPTGDEPIPCYWSVQYSQYWADQSFSPTVS